MQRRSLTLLALASLAACAGPQPEPGGEPARVVFFQGESATLDGPARAVVQAAAEAARRPPGARLTVLGYGGPVGGTFNRPLAEARTQHVAELLRQAGITVTTAARPPVAAEMAPIELRRVEIRFAP